MKLNTPWRNALGAASAALALALSCMLPTQALAAPAAGTVIGNQASATYSDGSGTTRTTTSNLVQTTVSQVKSYTLTADGARTAAAGQTVYYPHVITNLGNGVDTYALNTLTASGTFAHTGLAYYADADGNGIPDNSVPITSTGPVAAGAQFRFVVAAVVPGSATLGQTGAISVSATDSAGTGAANTDTTTVAASAVAVTQSLSSTSGPSPSAASLTVTLQYTNSGTAAATNLTLVDSLPAGMTYVPGSGRWSISGAATALTDDTTAADPAGITFDYGVTTAGKVTAVIASVGPGTTAQLTFKVTVNSGLSPTDSSLGSLCATAGCPALTTNTANYKTSSQTVSNTNSVLYTVLQSGNVSFNGSSSSNAAGASEPVTVASAAQGATVTFTTYVWNLGNGSDTFNVTNSASTFPAGTTFQLFKADGTTPLLDTNGDGTVDTGPVAASTTVPAKIVVKALLPTSGTTGTGVGGNGFSATFTATSVATPGATDDTFVKLSAITANTVDATIDAAVGGTGVKGAGPNDGTTVLTNDVSPTQSTSTTSLFKLFINNTGGAADSYDLSLQSSLLANWSLVFRADGGSGNCSSFGAAITNTGSIASGASKLVCALVTVPSIQVGATPANSTTLTIKAQSASTASSSDMVLVKVNILAVRSVTLSPNGTQQTYAGAAVTYTHVLTNIGNVNETVNFNTGFLSDSQTAAGWTSTSYLDTGNGTFDVGTDTLLTAGTSSVTLAPGESKTIFVRVFAPGSAAASSPANVTTVVATYTAGATATANDTTGITEGLLLLKEQVATGCAVTPASGYSANAIAAGANTAPGQCISYRITATNTTAATITAVKLADTIPANTVRHDACGAPTGSAGVTIGGTANANGTTGSVTADLASLAPTAAMSLTFCVQINP